MGIEMPSERSYSAMPDEIAEIRREAEDAGKDPDEAEAAFREKIEGANARAAEEAREKALRATGDAFTEGARKGMFRSLGEGDRERTERPGGNV